MRETGEDMKEATICAYSLPGGVKIERVEQARGDYKWAVRRGANCLGNLGEYEYEPMPSARDDEFLSRCRFDTAEQAYTAWENSVCPL